MIQRRCHHCEEPLSLIESEVWGPCDICSGFFCSAWCWDIHLGKHEDNNED